MVFDEGFLELVGEAHEEENVLEVLQAVFGTRDLVIKLKLHS